MHFTHTTHKKGFTLVDVVIGSALFVVIMSMFFGWIISSMQLSETLLRRFEATNISRSGIEVIEQLRNQAVLRRETLAHLLPLPGGANIIDKSYCFTLGESVTQNAPYAPWDLRPVDCSTYEKENIFQSGTNTTIGQHSYHRLIRITPRSDITPPIVHDSLPISTRSDDIIEVNVRTAWKQRGVDKEIELSKIFTLWPSLP